MKTHIAMKAGGAAFVLLAAILFEIGIASGQDMPANQFYIGYELQRPNLSFSVPGVGSVTTVRKTFNGMQVSDTVRVYRWLGVEGNFGVGYKQLDYKQLGFTPVDCLYFGYCPSAGSTNLTFFGLAGPRIQYSFGRVEPYGHFLLGTEHVHLDAASILTPNGAAYSTNGFALGGGGGVVLHVSRHFGIAGGVDYIHASKNIYGVTASTNTMRVTVGPTFTWGGGGGQHRDRMSAKVNQPSSGETAVPLLGVVVDSRRRIVLFYGDSALSNHGVELGDVINSVDGKETQTPEELASATSNLTKGATVKMGFLSRGQWQSWISVKL